MFGPIPDVEQRTAFNFRIYYGGRIYDAYFSQSFNTNTDVWCLCTRNAVKLGEYGNFDEALEAIVMKKVP